MLVRIQGVRARSATFCRQMAANSNTAGGDDVDSSTPLHRGAEARGSMREYLKGISERKKAEVGTGAAASSVGLWANISKKIGNPPNNQQSEQRQRPRQGQGGARGQRQGNQYAKRAPQQFRQGEGQQRPRQQVQQQRRPQQYNRGINNVNADIDADDQSSSTRAMNNRKYVAKKTPYSTTNRGRKGGEGSAVAMFGPGVGGGGSYVRNKRGRNNETEEQMQQSMQQQGGGGRGGYDGENEAVPPGVAALLFDNDYWLDQQSRGKLGNFLPAKSSDPIDELMAQSFIQSYKTNDSSYQTVLQSPQHNRTRIPQPRSIASLLHSIHNPPIHSAARGTMGHDLASEAWSVINKNYYMPDEHKYRLCDEIAAMTERFEEFTKDAPTGINGDAPPSSLMKEPGQPISHDAIFTSTFRSGLQGIEMELEQKAMEDNVPKDSNEFVQGETDWDVEAVVDEDQL